MDRKLQRSKNNKIIAGVCGGIAEYFAIDPTLIRLVWAVLVLADGFGILAYILAAIIIPEEKHKSTSNQFSQSDGSGYDSSFNPSEWKDKPKYNSEKGSLYIGGAIVLFGIFLLFREFFNWIDLKYLFPVILILIGIGIIYKARRNNF